MRKPVAQAARWQRIPLGNRRTSRTAYHRHSRQLCIVTRDSNGITCEDCGLRADQILARIRAGQPPEIAYTARDRLISYLFQSGFSGGRNLIYTQGPHRLRLRAYPARLSRAPVHACTAITGKWKLRSEATALDEIGMGVDFKVIKQAARGYSVTVSITATSTTWSPLLR